MLYALANDFSFQVANAQVIFDCISRTLTDATVNEEQ